MNQVTLKLNDMIFDVSVEGSISQPRKVSSTVLDEVRILASDVFLQEKLSVSQRQYWGAIRTITPEPKRGGFGERRRA